MYKNYCVYAHVFPNGKLYIGATRQNPQRRWRNGQGYKNTKLIYSKIQKFGWDNIQHIIVMSGLDEDIAMIVEKELIKKYKTQNRHFGYNTKDGGQHFGEHSEEFLNSLQKRMKGNTYCVGRKLSKKHIEALRNANLGRKRPSPYKGKPFHSEETKKILSEKAKSRWRDPARRAVYMEAVSKRNLAGENNPRYGVVLSEETKKKIAEKAKGRKASKEARKKMSDSSPFKKAVYQLSSDGTILNKYESIESAARAVNACSTNISFCCRHTNRSSHGYKWRYANEYDSN